MSIDKLCDSANECSQHSCSLKDDEYIARWPIRIYFEDTDAGGIVYHASYVAFYERARTEMLRQMGLNQHDLKSEHIAFVVRRINVEYLAVARLDDLLEVQTKIVSLSRATITFPQSILNAQGNLLNQAEVLVVCVNPILMKSIAFPEWIKTEFTPWLK